jgi:hypothetical protein
MLNAGVGEQQVNNILAELNLPCISHKTLKAREREIGETICTTADTSCDKAVHEEIEPGRYTACFQGEILLEIKQ